MERKRNSYSTYFIDEAIKQEITVSTFKRECVFRKPIQQKKYRRMFAIAASIRELTFSRTL